MSSQHGLTMVFGTWHMEGPLLIREIIKHIKKNMLLIREIIKHIIKPGFYQQIQQVLDHAEFAAAGQPGTPPVVWQLWNVAFGCVWMRVLLHIQEWFVWIIAELLWQIGWVKQEEATILVEYDHRKIGLDSSIAMISLFIVSSLWFFFDFINSFNFNCYFHDFSHTTEICRSIRGWLIA